ncbi:YTH domain-containing protein ECT2 isoform X1 [Musa acuminata AAA Group]|uniref:YTH domain-containing protein ECT2 isoform X1 n=1 Tax=Musa acuminata AAA Group TaxID=214697 RepID=UPI0031DEA2F3
MATTQQPPGRIDSLESLGSSTTNADLKPVKVESPNEQPPAKDEKLTTTTTSHDLNDMDTSRDAHGHLVSSDIVIDHNAVYQSNIFAPHAHSFFYGGYENLIGDWEDQSRYVNVEGVEFGLAGVYNENPSLVYHTGYGYSPYGPYSPGMTPLTSLSGDGQLYSPHQFQFPGAYYQQSAPPNMPYLSSSTPIPRVDLAVPIDQQGVFTSDTSNFNTQMFGPRPDLTRAPDGTGSVTPLSLPTVSVSPQPIGGLMPFGQGAMPITSGMGSQQQRSLYGFGSSISSIDRGYSHSGQYHNSTFETSIPSLGIKDQSSFVLDKNRRGGKESTLLCSCNGTVDFLNEQNRGPRANRSKIQMIECNSSLDTEKDSSTTGVDHKLYNSPDFVTEHKDAMFFIIKSYSEDNVHKSIKYGVWASTSSGNRKLDSAYHEAKQKEDPCPVFLFFSVNASAHFCGVSEMIGPVDFEKSVDYWQQDRWSGQFPVKWHMVKDVPNNLFRHIILENNENKPVTNSRDTQEVKLEKGLEMLGIFKKHEYEVSIIDDFEFYEEREKAMQERKARKHHQMYNSAGPVRAAFRNEQRNPPAISGDFINRLSKNFISAVRLEERNNADPATDKNSSLSVSVAPKPDELQKSETTPATTSS